MWIITDQRHYVKSLEELFSKFLQLAKIVKFAVPRTIRLPFLNFLVFFSSVFLLIVFFVTFILNFLLALVIFVINSREAIAEAIFVRLLFFLFRCPDFWYHNMTSKSLQICFLFSLSCNFNWTACVTPSFTFIGASFLLIRVIKFLVRQDIPHSQKWLPHSEIDFLFS